MHLLNSLLVVALATPLVVAGPGDAEDSSFSSLPTTDLTSSSSATANNQPSLTLVGTAPLGTGILSASENTQEVVITDVYIQFLSLALYTQADLKNSVYTTLTTCPVTSFVTSGSTSFEEITTTISTITRTSTSTLCTKCVAPPSKSAVSSSSPGETVVSSLPSFTIYSLSQPLLSLPSISTSSAAEALGTGGLSAILFSNIIPVIPLQTAISSKPEVPSTATFPSRSLVFPSFVSLTVSATSGDSSTLDFPGYGVVPPPTSSPGSRREEIFSNATSSIIPVYTAALLGNAYGGGFVSTPSVYVTKLPYPNGPSPGIPPGYGSESSIAIIENNVTAAFPGFQASSTSAAGMQSTTEIKIPAFTATGASHISALIGNLGASTIISTTSGIEAFTPTFISLSPFGGEVGRKSVSTAIPTVVSTEVPSSPSSTIFGIEGGVASSAAASAQAGNSESKGANVMTALIAAISPAGALSAEVSQVSNAMLSSLAAAGLPTSSVNVQAALVGSSTTSIIGSSGMTAESSFPTSAIIGGAAIIPSLPAEQSAGPVVTLAIGSSAEQVPAAGQPASSLPTPIIFANGSTALAVVPSPVVGANGLTSLAVFSTPIAPAAGLTTPAILLTPIVGANGLTSLAVVATPLVGANGLTSLAIGFETENIPAAGQSNSAPTPIEGFIVVQSPAFTPQVSGGIPIQANIAASGVANVALPSGSVESPVSGGSGNGNHSIHILLNPTAATQFQGSAVRLSLGLGIGLFGLIIFLVLL
ncbi:MAG: hypothetical protein Q9175_004756 [Cornicularia normoerica]